VYRLHRRCLIRNFIRDRWRLIGGLVLAGLLLSFVGSSYLIGRQVRDAVAGAQVNTPGDPVTALLAAVNSTDLPLRQRNRAIWALGQLGDGRALDTLEPLLTGQECDHTRDLCQHELEKAVDLCRGGTNIGALLWRHGEIAIR
jgi:hypothetical protein